MNLQVKKSHFLMNQLLSELTALSKQGKLMPAEEILTSKLVNFEEIVSAEKLTEKDVENIENILIALLNVNKGQISFHCSIKIANCLIKIYNSLKSPKLWNLITTTSKNPTVSKLYASAHVIKRFGHTSKSMLAGLVKSILSYIKSDESLYHPAMYLIRACYQISYIDVKSYDEKIIGLAKQSILLPHEHLQILAIKLMRTLAKSSHNHVQKILSIIDSAMATPSSSAFVDDELSYLIAKIAALPLLKQKKTDEIQEFAIGKQQNQESDFTETFSIFTKYSKNFSTIFRHFLDIISPQFLFENINIIFDFVRKNQLSDLSQILSLFGHDVRSNLFTQIAAEQPPTASQLHCLRFLASDKAMAHETAAVSLQLSSSEAEDARFACCQCISNLNGTYPDIATMYLETSMLCLATPPDDNPQIAADIRGFSLIASNIIGSSDDPENQCEKVSANITKFLQRALTANNVWAPDFLASFRLLAVLPTHYIPMDLAANQLALATKFVVENSVEANRQIKDFLRIVCSGIAKNPDIDGILKFIDAATKAENSLTNTSIIGLLMAMSKTTQGPIYQYLVKLLPRLLKENPPENLVKSIITSPMPPQTELLFHSIPAPQKSGPLYTRLTPQTFVIRVCELIPLLLSQLTKEECTQFLTLLINSNQNHAMSHAIILSIILSEKASLLPANLHMLVLDTLEDKHNDVERMRISAEIVSLWSVRCGYVDEAIKHINKWRGPGKCLIYASLFKHAELSDNDIVKAMHDLDELSKSSLSENAALFALISLYDSCCARLTAMPLVGTQCRILMSKIHSPSALSPYTLFFVTGAFAKLLPVLIPQGNKYDIDDMKLVSQMLSETVLPYSKQTFYHLVRNILAYSTVLNPNFDIVYPRKAGSSISLELSACGAFSDMIRVVGVKEDLFEVVPRAMLLLQKRDDPRPDDFIFNVATSSNNHKQEWVKIVKTVLSSNALPGFANATIEPMPQVKACCLRIALSLIDGISPGEMLDDIVTSATRAVETKIPRIVERGFPVLVKVIEQFDGQKCLDLYEPQISSCVKNSFSDMNIAKNFLLSVLSHASKKVSRGEDVSTLILQFPAGIESCEISPSAICVAAAFCSLLRQIPESENKVKLDVVLNYKAKFGEVLNDAMKIFSELDWLKISDFRANYEKSLADILSSIAFLGPSNCGITTHDLVTFLVSEIKCGEEWRVSSAFTGLAAVFKYENDPIDENLMLSALDAVENNPLLSSFSVSCAHRVSDKTPKAWLRLANLVFTKAFSKEAAAKLVHSGSEQELLEASEIISKAAVNNNTPQLFTMLLSKCSNSANKVLDVVLKSQLSINEKGDIVRLAVRKCQNIDRDDVCEFLWTTFKKGGMNTIATCLSENPAVGTKLFSFHDLKIIEDLCTNDATNSSVYMLFVRLGVELGNLNNVCLEAAARIAVRAISLLGNDPQKGSDIISTAAQLFKDVKAKSPEAAKNAFSSVNDREKQVAVGQVENAIAKSATKKKVRTLRTFSSSVRKVQEEEWQSLD